MVNDQILLPDGRKAITPVIANALGIARIVRNEFEIRPLGQAQELGELVEPEHAVHLKDLIVGTCERPLHEDLQIGGHGSFELEADDRPAPAALEHRFKLAHEVFRLFLDLDLGITDDAEGALALERVAGKEPAYEQAG